MERRARVAALSVLVASVVSSGHNRPLIPSADGARRPQDVVKSRQESPPATPRGRRTTVCQPRLVQTRSRFGCLHLQPPTTRPWRVALSSKASCLDVARAHGVSIDMRARTLQTRPARRTRFSRGRRSRSISLDHGGPRVQNARPHTQWPGTSRKNEHPSPPQAAKPPPTKRTVCGLGFRFPSIDSVSISYEQFGMMLCRLVLLHAAFDL